jgi:pimeloyl-ACP methyl ester carboxylesterase
MTINSASSPHPESASKRADANLPQRPHPDDSAVTRAVIRRGDTQIEILAQGAGPLMVLLPSLGRGAEDFDAIAVRLAAAGFRVLRPQPRGIGRSRGRMTNIDMHD